MKLLHILVRPRATIRAILDAPRDRAALWIVMAAMFGVALTDFDVKSPEAMDRLREPGMLLVVVGAVLAAFAVMVACYFLFAAVAMVVGRLFDGTGTFREMRSAVAWGTVPLVWSLLYRIPAAILLNGPRPSSIELGSGLSFSSGTGAGCLVALLNLAIAVWCFAITGIGVAEGHRFSTERGFATLIASLISPVVIIIAAALAAG